MHTYHRRTLLTTTAASMMAYLLYNWGQPLVRHAAAQAHWRWCHQCACLWWHGSPTLGVGSAGGPQARTGSGD